MTPTVRLILRALLVGVTTLLTQLQQSHGYTTSLVEGAIVAAVLAGLEVVTPLNAVVGLGKPSGGGVPPPAK